MAISRAVTVHAVALVSALLLLFSSPLLAGVVQDLDVSPNPGKAGQTVSFTPQGKGTCSQVELHFGDTMVKLLADVDFSAPPTVDYKYASAGTFEAKAKQASGNCSGRKSVQVVIEEAAAPPDEPGSDVDHLCEIIGCDRVAVKKGFPVPKEMAVAPPELKMALHFPPEGVDGDQTLNPGGTIRLGGEHFGSEQGRVYIYGIPGYNPLDLEILEWNKTKSQHYGNTALVRIPETPAKPFFPINVRLILARKGAESHLMESHKHTDAVDRQFAVPGEVLLLPGRYPAVYVEHCSEDGNLNRCNGSEDGEFCAAFGGVIGDADLKIGSPEEDTIRGVHINCAGAPEDDSGTDRYRITLKNGWLIHDITGKWAGSSSNEKVILPFGGDYVRKSEAVLPVSWEVSPADEIRYTMKVFIIGPPGTRYQ